MTKKPIEPAFTGLDTKKGLAKAWAYHRSVQRLHVECMEYLKKATGAPDRWLRRLQNEHEHDDQKFINNHLRGTKPVPPLKSPRVPRWVSEIYCEAMRVIGESGPRRGTALKNYRKAERLRKRAEEAKRLADIARWKSRHKKRS